MLIYFLRRLALTIPTFVALMFVTFVAIRLVPGDPVEVRVGERGISPERLALLRHQLGLDQPVWKQFLEYCWQHPARRFRRVAVDAAESADRVLHPVSGDRGAFVVRHAVRGAASACPRARSRRSSAAGRSIRSDDDLAVRLLDADLLVGPSAHHVRIGATRLDAGLRPHRPDQLLFRPADRLHAGRRGVVGSAGRGARRAPASRSCRQSCSAPCRSASSRA